MAFFVLVLGLVARLYGFRLMKFLSYIKEEIFIMLSTSNSESVLPRLMEKLQKLGCAKSVVALVLPTGTPSTRTALPSTSRCRRFSLLKHMG